MRLDELVDVERIRTVKGQFDTSKMKRLGSGVFASAYQAKGVNSIIKVAEIQSPRDPYLEYVQHILNHQDNPFFPKIYNAKMYRHEGGLEQLVVEMEKLHPLDREDLADVVPHLLNQIGIDANDMIDKPETPSETSPDVKQWRVSMKLLQYMNGIRSLKNLVDKADNPQFEQAAQVLIKLFESHNADMHAGNIMVRLTGTGPQLVITDPVA